MELSYHPSASHCQLQNYHLHTTVLETGRIQVAPESSPCRAAISSACVVIVRVKVMGGVPQVSPVLKLYLDPFTYSPLLASHELGITTTICISQRGQLRYRKVK